MHSHELFDIERETLKESFLHSLDARVKLASALIVILIAVTLGRSEVEFQKKLISLGALELYLIILAAYSKLNMRLFFTRLLLILPFGGSIALLKPFFEPGRVVFSLSFIRITEEGLMQGASLLFILIVSVSAVILLSSITRFHHLIGALRSFKVPNEFTLLLAMTLRFLFLYMKSFQKIVEAQKNRAFSLRNTKRDHIFRTLGYIATMIFIRAFKHGLGLYQAMLSRGYNPEKLDLGRMKKLEGKEIAAGILNIVVVIGIALAVLI